MVKAISLRVDIELSWSAASLAASSCSQSLFKALIIRGALKEINDSHGHASGDQVLVGVASRLQELMRSGDFLARYGGDEFLVLMTLRPASPEDGGRLRRDAHAMASRIAAGFDTPLDFGSVGLTITLSIGVTIMNPAKTSPQQAMQRSDAAMYRAKLQKLGRIAIFEADDPSWSAEEFQASERLPAL